ncbi:MAG: hypothetical protein P8M72_09985 [Gammaproteobacteria bacterium]|nr:hypothetical protein [Gammaproteobacteria bacterium]
MRALAEYVMLGRRQAIIIVLLCGFFPFLNFFSAAVVALVTLRKGRNEGLVILLWSMLPAGSSWAMGDISPMFLMTGTFAMAMALRNTLSWQLVLLLATAIGLATQLSLLVQTGYQVQIEFMVNDSLQAQLNQDAQAQYTAEQIVDLLISFYGAYHALMVTICLMIGRWWQSLLYNPGGFQQEFHNLRIDPRVMTLLLGVILVGLMDIPPLDRWLPLFCIVPMLAGLAIAHYMVAKKTMGTPWLVLIYATVLMMAPAIILLGLTDSLLDLRKRIDQPKE